jgi:putative phosphoesterase
MKKVKLGVLSDSHINKISDLPKKIIDLLEDVDLVIHAGDYDNKELIDNLRNFKNFKGVHGNMDSKEIKNELPSKLIFEINHFKIGVTHPQEGGSPFGIENRLKKKFNKLDLIIFGHTHAPKNEIIDEILYFNPGSATGKWPASHKTFGIIEIDEKIKGKIIKLD